MAWRNRKIEGEHPYVFLVGIWLKRTWGVEVQKVAVLVAIRVKTDGHPMKSLGFARVCRRTRKAGCRSCVT